MELYEEGCLISNEQQTFQGKLQPIAYVQRIEKRSDFLKILVSFVLFSYRDDEVINIVHDAGLKKVFQKLVIHIRASGLHFDNGFRFRIETVRFKIPFQFSIESEQYGNLDFFRFPFSIFNEEMEFKQIPPDGSKNFVANKVMGSGIDRSGIHFKCPEYGGKVVRQPVGLRKIDPVGHKERWRICIWMIMSIRKGFESKFRNNGNEISKRYPSDNGNAKLPRTKKMGYNVMR